MLFKKYPASFDRFDMICWPFVSCPTLVADEALWSQPTKNFSTAKHVTGFFLCNQLECHARC